MYVCIYICIHTNTHDLPPGVLASLTVVLCSHSALCHARQPLPLRRLLLCLLPHPRHLLAQP